METSTGQYCKACGQAGTGKFCSNCGQSYSVKRITLQGLLHDVFHFFTHLEKGFGYTIKRLITSPGTMQREFVAGVRSRYQKAFSMFFICLSINAIARYTIERLLIRYFASGNAIEADLYHEFQLFLILPLVPLLTLLTWMLFAKNKYNYAETGVLQLYTLAFFLMASIVTGSLRFIWPHMDAAYVELPLFTLYAIITNVNFYNRDKVWVVVVKTVVLTVLFFLMVQYMEDFTKVLISKRKG